METAAIALGANLGDRLASLRTAASMLAAHGGNLRKSPVYETVPMGPPQPDYLNAVVLLETSLSPEELLHELLSIEQALGRVRRERWGPRVIDLDLLVHGSSRMHTPALTLPHPEIPHRAFVLRPWAELAPTMEVPGLGSVQSLFKRLPLSERESLRILTRDW
jgi:2-amino-4-hydroxy-6-hydroxymethyldihydropteridine diphosphokinase